MSDRRLEGETPLRQAQLAELHILDVFVAICEKHKLTYFLESGTLLGAMRHGGFIPWDDDIDIGMPIKDYRSFLKIAPGELPENLLLTPGREYSALHPFAKIYDRSSFFCEKDTDIRHPCGIYIDIFPYTKQPLLPRAIGWGFMRASSSAWELNREHRFRLHRRVVGIFYSALMATFWAFAYHSFAFLQALISPFFAKRWRYRLGIWTAYYHSGFSNAELFPTRPIAFEGKEYAAPHNPEGYLTAVYGDWRTPPPVEKRHWHGTILAPTTPPKAAWAREYRVPQERETEK